jgi:hypothetical protein
MRSAIVLGLAACAGTGPRQPALALRPACDDASHVWTGTACTTRGDGAAQVAAGKAALVQQDVEHAKKALDAAAERGGPLDHDTHVTLWEQRAIAAAFLEDEPGATAAFDMLLALDPDHFLSYTLAPQVTFVFEKARRALRGGAAPAIDLRWPSGQRVGDPVPLDVEVVADPKRFLRRAAVYVRARGEAWRAADVALAPAVTRVTLPAITAAKPTSLELYLRAFDDRGNEVLAWAGPERPREIPLRYDPPPPWYRNWKVYAVGVPIAVVVTGAIVYGLTLAPPDKVGADAAIR